MIKLGGQPFDVTHHHQHSRSSEIAVFEHTGCCRLPSSSVITLFASSTLLLSHGFCSFYLSFLHQLLPYFAQHSHDSKQKSDEPFQIEVRSGYAGANSEAKYYVLISSSTTVRRLAQAIQCELNLDSPSKRLVVTGKTIYSTLAVNSHVGQSRTMKEQSTSLFDKVELD